MPKRPMAIIQITELGQNAHISGSQRNLRWQIIKLHNGKPVPTYLKNSGKLGAEALRRRMRDGWVIVKES